MTFLLWIERSWLGQFIASDTYAAPALLCFHAVGMGIVVGAIWMYNFRILGFSRRMSFTAFTNLKRVAWIGFFLNLASGVLLFTASASRLIVNLNFQLKMLFMVLGGLTVWWLARVVAQGSEREEPASFPMGVKAIAVVSALFWCAVIFTGRYIAYTLGPPNF